jgi:hypothetical protein
VRKTSSSMKEYRDYGGGDCQCDVAQGQSGRGLAPGQPGGHDAGHHRGQTTVPADLAVTDGLPLTVRLSAARPGNRPGRDLN